MILINCGSSSKSFEAYSLFRIPVFMFDKTPTVSEVVDHTLISLYVQDLRILQHGSSSQIHAIDQILGINILPIRFPFHNYKALSIILGIKGLFIVGR